jgi:hypothetical protein
MSPKRTTLPISTAGLPACFVGHTPGSRNAYGANPRDRLVAGLLGWRSWAHVIVLA